MGCQFSVGIDTSGDRVRFALALKDLPIISSHLDDEILTQVRDTIYQNE